MSFSRRGRPLAEEEKSTDAAKARARAMELLAGQELSSGQLYERLGRKFTQPTAAAVVAETTSATPGPGRTACWPPARAAALLRRICGRRGWTPSKFRLRWKRSTPRTKRAETRSWKPPPPSWKGGTAASCPQGGKTLWWLRWPGGGLHILL